MADQSIVRRGLAMLGLVPQLDATAMASTLTMMPRGLTVSRFIDLSNLLKPADYRSSIEEVLRFYRGTAQQDIRRTLSTAFPRSYRLMQPVAVPLIERIIKAQAAVYSGSPQFELLDGAGAAVSAKGAADWKQIVKRCGLQRHLQQTNRITRLCRRSFVRVTWDANEKRVRLTTFTPETVHVLFHADDYSLSRSEGVLLEVAPALVGERLLKRWEFWSAGERPLNFVIDELGNFTGANEEFKNPYVGADGRPIVPIVAFNDEEDCAGYWLEPRRAPIDLQKAIDADQTNLRHIARTQSHGQWKSGFEPGIEPGSAGDWVGQETTIIDPTGNVSKESTIGIGPDRIIDIPPGRTLENAALNGKVDVLDASMSKLIRLFMTLESLPPGQMIDQARQISGYAMVVERQPLTKLRNDQVALYQQPTEELIGLIRTVWDAHQDSNAERDSAT
jgi:hypothetical protein